MNELRYIIIHTWCKNYTRSAGLCISYATCTGAWGLFIDWGSKSWASHFEETPLNQTRGSVGAL